MSSALLPLLLLNDLICNVGSIAQIIAYTIIAPAPPFPAFVIAYAINGFGISLQVSPYRQVCLHDKISSTTRRTPVRTALWLALGITQRLRWESCTLSTVTAFFHRVYAREI